MNTTFKKATIDDIAGIISLCNECFNENTDIEKAKQIFETHQHDQNQIYLIGEKNRQIVAHAKVNIIPTIYDGMGTYAILNHVCVKPEFCGTQIGSRLINECFKIAKENNCNTVKLWSKSYRVDTHRFYHKHGFEIVDAKFFDKDMESHIFPGIF